VRRVRPVLVIEQELALEGLGFLGERLEASGLPYRRLQLWREDLGGLRARDFSAIVPLGGNAHAWQESDYPFLRRERLLLADALEEGAPVLGICLGAQLLARALGAEVRTAEAPEIGWLPIAPTAEARNDPLFGHLTAPTGVYQWHHDVFELPAGARLLATSERFENQAFRAGDAWGSTRRSIPRPSRSGSPTTRGQRRRTGSTRRRSASRCGARPRRRGRFAHASSTRSSSWSRASRSA
jgi:GMP synthase (glutamine-hydrolysing)